MRLFAIFLIGLIDIALFVWCAYISMHIQLYNVFHNINSLTLYNYFLT